MFPLGAVNAATPTRYLRKAGANFGGKHFGRPTRTQPSYKSWDAHVVKGMEIPLSAKKRADAETSALRAVSLERFQLQRPERHAPILHGPPLTER